MFIMSIFVYVRWEQWSDSDLFCIITKTSLYDIVVQSQEGTAPPVTSSLCQHSESLPASDPVPCNNIHLFFVPHNDKDWPIAVWLQDGNITDLCDDRYHFPQSNLWKSHLIIERLQLLDLSPFYDK